MVLLVQKYMVLSMMYINVKLLYDSNLNLNIAKMVLFMTTLMLNYYMILI